jgi:hypothetical protein
MLAFNRQKANVQAAANSNTDVSPMVLTPDQIALVAAGTGLASFVTDGGGNIPTCGPVDCGIPPRVTPTSGPRPPNCGPTL